MRPAHGLRRAILDYSAANDLVIVSAGSDLGELPASGRGPTRPSALPLRSAGRLVGRAGSPVGGEPAGSARRAESGRGDNHRARSDAGQCPGEPERFLHRTIGDPGCRRLLGLAARGLASAPAGSGPRVAHLAHPSPSPDMHHIGLRVINISLFAFIREQRVSRRAQPLPPGQDPDRVTESTRSP